MIKNSLLDFRNLCYMEILKIKNLILSYFREPLKGIKQLIIKLLPFIFMIYAFIKGIKTNGNSNVKFSVNPKLEGAILMAILLIILFYTLNKAVDKYNPGQFKLSDVHYLFTSPISSRTIYAFTMFRSFFSDILLAAFYGVFYVGFISKFTAGGMSKGLYVAIAMFLVTMFMRNIKFLVYTLSSRFKMRKFLKIFVRLITVITALYIVVSLDYSNVLGSLINVLNGEVLTNFTVVGLAKDIINSITVNGTAPVFQISIFVFIIILTVIIGILFASDYYEEATLRAEEISTAMESNKDLTSALEIDDNKKIKKVIDVKVKEFKGEWAFIWKNNVIKKRRTRPITKIIIMIIEICAAVAIGIYANDMKKFMTVYIFIFIGLTMTASSFTSYVIYELKKQYIYMTPGRASYKILAVSLRNISDKLLGIILITLPAMIFSHIDKKFIIYTAVILLLSFLIVYFSTVVSRIFVGLDLKKSGIMDFVLEIIFLIIPMVSAGYINDWFGIDMAFIAFSLISLLIMAIIFIIIDKLFYRIEI